MGGGRELPTTHEVSVIPGEHLDWFDSVSTSVRGIHLDEEHHGMTGDSRIAMQDWHRERHLFGVGGWMPEDAGEVEEDRVARLRGWWETVSTADFDGMLPKISEYTALDLEIMGDVMQSWLGLQSRAIGMEAAVMFYVLGKVARAVAAYREGREPSLDTIHDIRVYAFMAQHIREEGRWP